MKTLIASDHQPLSSSARKLRTPKETGISDSWKPYGVFWVGSDAGEHCHWCKHMISEDGAVNCGHPDTKFEGRIRTWDGAECARECDLFELDDWYKSEENFKKTFPPEKGDQNE